MLTLQQIKPLILEILRLLNSGKAVQLEYNKKAGEVKLLELEHKRIKIK